jgi:hypothetical protein
MSGLSSPAFKLSSAIIFVSSLCWTNTVTAADPVLSVRLINRSITKSQVYVWDENQSHKVLLNETLGAGAERTVKAVAKSPTNPRDNEPGIHVSWKIEALDDQGFPLKPGAKPPVRCGAFTTPHDNQRFEVSPYNNVPGSSC